MSTLILVLACVLVLVLSLLAAVRVSRGIARRKRSSQRASTDPFIIKPYLQLGDRPARGPGEQVEVIWFTSDDDALWALEARPAGQSRWIEPELPSQERFAIKGASARVRYRVRISRLSPGQEFEYRVLKNGREVFAARATAPKGKGQPLRFVAAADLARNSLGSRKIAHRISMARPDLLVIPGDVVYKHGRVSEYSEHFFPAYNKDGPGPDRGGPVLRSTLSVAALGNHDAGTPDLWDVRDFKRFPDLLGYFLFFSQPLNGPALAKGDRNTPDIAGPREDIEAFLKIAGSSYPRMSNFSFDYGDAHWLVLDGNNYMNWEDPALRGWVEKDLEAARSTAWKFVIFHQPPFSTDVKHRDEQRMRLLCDIFQKHGVDVVFSGHNHAYERNHPLTFAIRPQADGSLQSPEGRVDGDWTLDREFDGKTSTRPKGVLYLVVGGGGGRLYLEPERRAQAAALPPYNRVLVDDVHSFALLELEAGRLSVRVISEDGDELDAFVVTK